MFHDFPHIFLYIFDQLPLPQAPQGHPRPGASAPPSLTSSAAAAWRRCRRRPPRARDGPPRPPGAGRGRWGCDGWPWHLGTGMGGAHKVRVSPGKQWWNQWFKMVWPKSTCAIPEFGWCIDAIQRMIHHLPPYPPTPITIITFPFFGQAQNGWKTCETGFPIFQHFLYTIIYINIPVSALVQGGAL